MIKWDKATKGTIEIAQEQLVEELTKNKIEKMQLQATNKKILEEVTKLKLQLMSGGNK